MGRRAGRRAVWYRSIHRATPITLILLVSLVLAAAQKKKKNAHARHNAYQRGSYTHTAPARDAALPHGTSLPVISRLRAGHKLRAYHICRHQQRSLYLPSSLLSCLHFLALQKSLRRGVGMTYWRCITLALFLAASSCIFDNTILSACALLSQTTVDCCGVAPPPLCLALAATLGEHAI